MRPVRPVLLQIFNKHVTLVLTPHHSIQDSNTATIILNNHNIALDLLFMFKIHCGSIALNIMKAHCILRTHLKFIQILVYTFKVAWDWNLVSKGLKV